MENGRKYKITLICVGLLVAGFITTGIFPSTQAGFGQFAMGLSGLLGLYCGGNVGSKLVNQKKQELYNEMGE